MTQTCFRHQKLILIVFKIIFIIVFNVVNKHIINIIPIIVNMIVYNSSYVLHKQQINRRKPMKPPPVDSGNNALQRPFCVFEKR